MLIVPIQFACALEQGVHAHDSKDLVQWSYHTHLQDDDHGHPHHDELAADNLAATGMDYLDDGHHDSHYHPVFSSLAIEPGLSLADAAPGGPVSRPPTPFISRIPPLFERPPALL